MNCRILAEQLRSSGTDPRLAVVVGLLVGGADVQVPGASAEIRQIGVRHQINVFVNQNRHWHMNLLTGLFCDSNCSGSCCQSLGLGIFSGLEGVSFIEALSPVNFGTTVFSVVVEEEKESPGSYNWQ